MFVNPSTSPSLVSTIPGTNPTRNTAPIKSLSIRMLSGFAFLPYDAGFVKTAKHGRQGFFFGVNGSGFPSNIIKWSRHRAVNNNSAPIRPVQSFPCPAEQCQFLNRQFFRHKVILVFVLLIRPYFEQTVIVCEKRWRRLRPRMCPTEIVNSSKKSRGYVALIVMDSGGPACDAEIWPYDLVQDNHIPTYHIRMSVGKEKVYNWEIWDYHCAVWLEVNVASWFSAFLLLLSPALLYGVSISFSTAQMGGKRLATRLPTNAPYIPANSFCPSSACRWTRYWRFLLVDWIIQT